MRLRSNYEPKVAVLAMAVFASGLIFWYLVKLNLFYIFHDTGLLNRPELMVGVVLVFALHVVLLGLSFIAVSSWQLRALLAGLAALSSIWFARFGAENLAAIMLVLAAGYFLWGQYIRYDVRTRIKFSIGRSIQSGIGFLLTVVLVIVAAIFYLDVRDVQDPQLLKQRIRSAALMTVDLSLRAALPGFQPGGPLEEFAASIVRHPVYGARLRAQLVRDAGRKIPDALIAQALSQQLRELVGAGPREPLSVDETTSRLFERFALPWLTRYEALFPFGFATSLFLFLNLFRWLYHGLIIMVAYLLYRGLIAARFVRVAFETVVVERLTIENSKSESRNSKQAQIPKIQMTKTARF